MTRLLAALLAVCVAGNAVARTRAPAPPQTCQGVEDRSAFEIEGLKSQLMVTALTCKQQDKYNAFIRQYQPAVAGNEKLLQSYFKRAYGRTYQKAFDDYISNLANAQAESGLKAGSIFCSTYDAMFDEVMKLHDASELVDYARSQALTQPISFEECVAPPPAPAKSKTKVRATRKKA